jgi:hypothetical protein
MKPAFILAATVLTSQPPENASTVIVPSNLAISGHQGAVLKIVHHTKQTPPPPPPENPPPESPGVAGATGLLPPDRNASANWSSAGMLSVGGIPTRTTVCATVNPLGSAKDDTANIQNAIAACPPGQVVQLAAGAFTIAEGNFVLLNKGITLSGAGPGVTILQRTNGAQLNSYTPGSKPSPMIIVGPQRWNITAGTTTTLTADAAAGSSSIDVASTAGFSVGQIVLLDEASGASWQPDVIWTKKQVWASPDYRVVWQKHTP